MRDVIIDQFHGLKIVAGKVIVHYFICSSKVMVHLIVLFTYGYMGLPQVCSDFFDGTGLVITVGIRVAGPTPGQPACKGYRMFWQSQGLVLLGWSPPTVAATAPQLLCLYTNGY